MSSPTDEPCYSVTPLIAQSNKTPLCMWRCLALPERAAYAVIAAWSAVSSPFTPTSFIKPIFQAASSSWWEKRYDAWVANGGLEVAEFDGEGGLVEGINNLNLSTLILTAEFAAGTISVSDPLCQQLTFAHNPGGA